MASETEIERIVVRLMGEDSSYQKMIDRAVASGQKMERMAQKTSKAEEQLNEAMRQGAAVTRSVESETEKYNRVLSEMSDLYNKGGISLKTFNRVMEQHKQLLPEFADQNQKAAAELNSFSGQLLTVGATMTTVGAIVTGSFVSLGTQAIMSAGKFEQTTIAFSTMLGSEKEAQKLLFDLTKFAAETPFEMPEIEQAARGLVQFGERGDELMDTLKLLGNAAAATSTDFGMVALIFNQVRGVGHLLTQDFRQLSTRGILSLQDIAKHYKITTEAAQHMLSEGRISFDDLKDIFRNLSGEGGRFANLMEKQSQSILGKWSTLKDNFNIFLRNIGEQLTWAAGKVIDFGNSVMTTFSTMSPWMKKFIAYGGLAAAAIGTMITAAGGFLLMAGGLVASYSAITTALAIETSAAIAATAATAMFWATATAGIAVIVGATYALYRWIAMTGEYNDATAKGVKLTEQLNAAKKATATSAVAAGNKIENLDDRKAFFEQEVRMANQAEAATTNAVKSAKKHADSLAPTWISLWQAGRAVHQESLTGVTDAEEHAKTAASNAKMMRDALLKSQGSEAIKAEIETVGTTLQGYSASLAKANADVRSLSSVKNPTAGQKEALDAAKKSAGDYADKVSQAKNRVDELEKLGKLKTTEEFTKAREELDKQLKSAGKTPLQAKVDEFKKQGVDPSLVAKFEQDSKKAENIQKQAEFTKGIDDQIKKMDEERQMWGLVGDAATIAKAEMEAADIVGTNPQAAQAMSEKLAALRAALKEQGVAQLAKDVDDYAKSLKTANDQIGMSNQELEIHKLQLRGATDEQLKLVRAEMKRGKDLNAAKEGDEMIKKLQEQAATFGMSADAALAYQLRLKGMSEEQIGVIVGLQKQATLADKMKSVKESLKTPDEKRQEQKLELDEGLKAGLLTTEEYTKAMAKLGEQASKTGKEINKSMGVDVAQAGSAEALARINASLEGQTGRFGGLPMREVPKEIAGDRIAKRQINAAARIPQQLSLEELNKKQARGEGLTQEEQNRQRVLSKIKEVEMRNRPDPGLQERASVGDSEEKNIENVANGVMMLVELTRQMLGKEPVLFEEASLV